MSDTANQEPGSDPLLASAPRDEQDRPTLGEIPLLRKLGQGGMASVYFGFHPRLHCEVAVKVLFPQVAKQDPTVVRRFYTEAQVAVQISSAHLVRVFDVHQEGDLYYMVQEFVAGPSGWAYLKDAVDAGYVGLSESAAIAMVAAATQGLVEAHKREIVHRDLKPDNILIPLRYGEHNVDLESAKLADLGVAKYEEPGSSMEARANVSLGTPGFVAPEQALDASDSNSASDVFSMGATLYSLLAGRAPYQGATPEDIIVNTVQNRRESIKKFQPSLSRATVDLIHRCLRPKEDERYLHAIDLLQALNNLEPSDNPAPRAPTKRKRRSTKVLVGGEAFNQKKLAMAREKFSSGDRDGAAALLGEVLEENPDNFEAQQLQRRVRGGSQTMVADAHDTRTNLPRVPTSFGKAPNAAAGTNRFSIHHVLKGHEHWLRSARFDTTGTRLVTGSDDKSARVWDVATGACLLHLIGDTGPIHNGPVLDARFNRDGRMLVTACQDHSARVWETESGRILRDLRHPSWVNTAQFTPDSSLILSSCLDGYVRLWDVAKGQEQNSLMPHMRSTNCATLSPDGTRFATASNDKTAIIYGSLGLDAVHRLEGHTRSVNSANFSRDGTQVVTASDDQTIRVWDARSGECVYSLDSQGSAVSLAALSPAGTMIIAVAEGNAALLWDTASRQLVQSMEVHTKPLRCAAFSADGLHVVTASEDLTACVWTRSG